MLDTGIKVPERKIIFNLKLELTKAGRKTRQILTQ